MKLEKNQHYFTICVYAVLSTIVVLLTTIVLFKWNFIISHLKTFLHTFFQVIKPVLFAFLFAYLMDPIVSFYDKKCITSNRLLKKNLRGITTTLAIGTLIAFLGLLILIIQLNIKEVLGKGSLNNFLQGLDYYRLSFEAMLEKATIWISSSNLPFINQEIIYRLYNMVNSLVGKLSEYFFRAILLIGTNTIDVLFAFVIAFYFLKDKSRILAFWNKLLDRVFTRKVFVELRKTGKDIDYIFSGYIRGQLIDSFIVAVLISTTLTVIGIDFAIIIGLVAGIFNLIPYFGPVVGFILAGLIGGMGPVPIKGLYAIIAVVIIQQIDGWIIVPKIIGESVKLPPVVVLVSVLIGGSLFGLFGMLFAVPIVAFLKVWIIRHWGNKMMDKE